MLQKIELIIWMSKSQRGLTESRGSLEKVDPEIVLSSLETKFQEECLLGVRTVREVKAEDSTEIDLKEHLMNADPMEEEEAMAAVAAMEVADHSTEVMVAAVAAMAAAAAMAAVAMVEVAMVEVAMEIDNNPKIETILIKVILIRSLLSLLHQVQTVLILALQLTKQALIILAISKAKETEERYVIQIRVDHFISA